MERLTERTESGRVYLVSEPETDIYGNLTEKGFEQLDKIYERLAAYEDTGLAPDEIPQLEAQLDAAVADLKSCRLDRVRTCANYQKCFDKAKEEFRMMPCMSKSCPGWEWRGPQPPKEEK